MRVTFLGAVDGSNRTEVFIIGARRFEINKPVDVMPEVALLASEVNRAGKYRFDIKKSHDKKRGGLNGRSN